MTQPETSNSEETRMATITPPDLEPAYKHFGEALLVLNALDDRIEGLYQAALGVDNDDGTWDDSGDDTEPFTLMKRKIGEARLALTQGRSEIAYVEGARRLGAG
jgi:hypothetical protein